MWLRVCSLIGRVVWDPVAACLEDWHNNTGSQHLSAKGWGGGRSRQVKNYVGFLIKCIRIQLRIKRNENNLCAGEDNMWATENVQRMFGVHTDCRFTGVFLVMTCMRVCWCVSFRVQLNQMWQCQTMQVDCILNNIFFVTISPFPATKKRSNVVHMHHSKIFSIKWTQLVWINTINISLVSN